LPRAQSASYSDISLFLALTPTAGIYTLSLHDALPIWGLFAKHRLFLSMEGVIHMAKCDKCKKNTANIESERKGKLCNDCAKKNRSEEHTSELQSRENLVCRLLLEKKKKKHSMRIP